MTIASLEGRLEIPPDPGAVSSEFGFSERAIPPGAAAISERFYPNPVNEPGATAIFNVFVVSINFSGDVYLIKYAPSDSEHFKKRGFRVMGAQDEVRWPMLPEEAIADSVQEPENGTSYALAIFGSIPGEHIYFRLST